MSRKTTELYEAVLRLLHELIPQFKPSQIITVDRAAVQRSTVLVNITGQHYQSILPVGLRTSSHAFAADFWSERYIRYINTIFV